jgi:hypothetical protein
VPKAALKFCSGGHRQTSKYRPGDACYPCLTAERDRLMADPDIAARHRAAELAKLGPIPEAMTMRCGDGTVITYRLPAHCQRKRRR